MKFKRMLAITLSLLMLFTSLPAIAASAASTVNGTSKETALNVSPNSSGTFVYNYFDGGNDKIWFNFTLPQRGVLNFDCTKIYNAAGNTDNISFYLYKNYDVTNSIWTDYSYNYSNTLGNYNFNIPLDAGSYYLVLDTSLYKTDYRVLNYTFKFTASSSWEIEPNNGANLATPVKLNKAVYGYTDYSYDYYSVTVSKDTPVRLKIGNYAGLAEVGAYFDITLADGTTEYVSSSDIVATKKYSYTDVLFKKGTNVIRVSRKTPAVKYYICPSTSISYSGPTIKKVQNESYSSSVYWEVMNGVDGYEVYRKINNGSWKLLKDLNYRSYEGVTMYDINKSKVYQIKVRAYKMFGKTKYYGNWSKSVYLNNTPTNIKLSGTSFAYNGKTKTPSVTIKDVYGNKLTKNKHYTVSYSSGRKKIGTYKVTIKFKGIYSGKVVKTFKIVPKGTSVSKVTSGSKSLKVSWKKQTSQTTGYQVQVSTSKKFSSGNKTVTISKNKSTSATIKSLKAKKTYYVRVRTYKTINGQKYYSAWSKTLTKKTK